MRYGDYCGERVQRHIEKCDFCSYLDEHGHPEDCRDCGHPWHTAACSVEDRGDVPDERYKGGYVAIGPCPCEYSRTLTQDQIEKEQMQHADECAQAAYDRHIDQKISEWKERGL